MDIVCKNAWIVDGKAFDTYIEAEKYLYEKKKFEAARTILSRIEDSDNGIYASLLIEIIEGCGFKYSHE